MLAEAEAEAADDAYQAEQGHSQSLVSIVEQPLVEKREQGIQDGTVGLEDLVNEGHLSCWQVAVCLPCVLIIFQACPAMHYVTSG